MIRKWTLCAIIYFGIFTPLWGQKASPVAEKNRERELLIEVRELPSNGASFQGIVPDSLGGDYYVGKEGVVYKLFNHVEPFVAHYNGHHPRPKATAQRHIVYIKSFEDAGKFELSFPEREGADRYMLRYDLGTGQIERIDR